MMRLFKTENVKKLMLVNVIIMIVMIITLSISTALAFKTYERNVNVVLAGVLDEVKQQYPEVDEEKIISIFEKQKITQVEAKELSKYGIDARNTDVIISLRNSRNTTMKINVIITSSLGLLMFLVLILYLFSERKKIDYLTDYISAINKKDYTLRLTDNEEGTFSKLQNELYKITVMLREEADNSKKEQLALTTSVEDISHQLKTPLTSVKIMLDNIRDNDNVDPVVQKDFLNDINKQIDKINFLVLSMLKLAKFDAGIITFKSEKIIINDLINAVINDLSVLIDVSNAHISSQIDDGAFIIGDFTWQKEAITNIVKNCIEHTPVNGEIKIKCVTNPIYTKLTITDNGLGIDNKDLKNIFKRFYKGKNSDENSVGIGLALSKSIIEKDNGLINVESVINKGTTFEIKYYKS